MRIINLSDIPEGSSAGSVVTIGNFDGVHRGHSEIFRRLRVKAAALGLPSVAVTFEPHPLSVLSRPVSPPTLITTFSQKCSLITDEGVDCLVVIDFSQSFAMISAGNFVREQLCGRLGMRHIIIGHDYCFGRGREGNFATLEQLGRECGFTVEDMDPVGEEGEIFSSSLARRLVAAGDMLAAARILGRYHVIAGTVIHGREIGREIGFPTANLTTDNELLPPDGVYAVKVHHMDEWHDGACSIGVNPTFGGGGRSLEVFLLDYSGDLYGVPLQLGFVSRLREIRAFAGIDELKRAIAGDVSAARKILAQVDPVWLKACSSLAFGREKEEV